MPSTVRCLLSYPSAVWKRFFPYSGVYTNNQGKTKFLRTKAPVQKELTLLVHTVSHRVARFLERQGVLERDEENSYLQLEGIDEDPMQQLMGCSVSYRISVGSQQGRKVFTLQTLPAIEQDERYAQVAKEAGCSLHAGGSNASLGTRQAGKVVSLYITTCRV